MSVQLAATYSIRLADLDEMGGLDLGPFQLRPLGRGRRRRALLDTPQRALTRAGHALWLSEDDDGAALMLADAGHPPEPPAAGDLNAAAHAPDPLDRASWPREIVESVETLAGADALTPVLEEEVERR